MADSKTNNQAQPEFNCFKEAVCINAQRIYDSCSEQQETMYQSPFSKGLRLFSIGEGLFPSGSR